jgi:2-polyprenyl-3-methyl-5-hydroxy-6-metoxy-1,4-benzoquinol methylase
VVEAGRTGRLRPTTRKVMLRIPEPELMNDEAQARAYAEADFEAPHSHFIELFQQTFPNLNITGSVLDLGCGPADISLRFARAYPDCEIHAVDAAEAMLAYADKAIQQANLAERIHLVPGYLPSVHLPREQYDVVISNSLLHHLTNPISLWQVVQKYAAPGAPVYIMDLMRPSSKAAAQTLMAEYAADEPPVLQHDFYHSLLAAYTPQEVKQQLSTLALPFSVKVASDRHLVVSGVMTGSP